MDKKKEYEVFMGRIGNDPELKYTNNQKALCELSIAVDGAGSTNTKWRNVIIWGKQAEKCPLYLKKGYKVFIEGLEEVRVYTNSKGEQKSYKQVVANLVGFPSL